ncbi:MAG: hypothetical protein KF843_15160 [Flavobacteriales bacterium]|nr:hypothetical protein [Flavobacteriales bacterium]
MLVSWLIGRRMGKLDELLIQERYQLCFSPKALAELAEVTRRPNRWPFQIRRVASPHARCCSGYPA